MAFKQSLFAFMLIAGGSPVTASQPEPIAPSAAPEAPPTVRYCLRVDPTTGSRMETIRCETRADWAAMEVDVDAEWAKWGVRVVTAIPGYGV